jgi:hydrogenase maturation protease
VNELLAPLVVIGLGNVLLRDDALGVRVVEGLRELSAGDPLALPAGTRLVDGGALLVDLLHTVRDARGLVLVDAVRTGGPEGSVSVLRGDAIAPADGAHSQAVNEIGDMLAIAQLMGWLPADTALVGVEAADTGFGTELSPGVAAALPRAIATVCDELRAMDEQIAARRLAPAAPTHTTGAPA